jgi:hypothetical protein
VLQAYGHDHDCKDMSFKWTGLSINSSEVDAFSVSEVEGQFLIINREREEEERIQNFTILFFFPPPVLYFLLNSFLFSLTSLIEKMRASEKFSIRLIPFGPVVLS